MKLRIVGINGKKTAKQKETKNKATKRKNRNKKKATIKKKNKQTNAKRWDKREINESNTHSFYSIMIRLKRLN